MNRLVAAMKRLPGIGETMPGKVDDARLWRMFQEVFFGGLFVQPSVTAHQLADVGDLFGGVGQLARTAACGFDMGNETSRFNGGRLQHFGGVQCSVVVFEAKAGKIVFETP